MSSQGPLPSLLLPDLLPSLLHHEEGAGAVGDGEGEAVPERAAAAVPAAAALLVDVMSSLVKVVACRGRCPRPLRSISPCRGGCTAPNVRDSTCARTWRGKAGDTTSGHCPSSSGGPDRDSGQAAPLRWCSQHKG